MINAESLLADLTWRDLIAQTTDFESLKKDLAAPLRFYVGFDPTAPSLHIGNLAVILTMRRLQLAGHLPIALVGGATGLVGDPSGRNEERSLNTEAIVANWVERIRVQLSAFLAFDGDSAAVMANNLDWTAKLSALELLRDIGKHFSVNNMLSKDSVSSRLESGGISYTEFSYQILQANDYLQLFRDYNCRLQIGGSDQWGNIVAGLDLIRRVDQGSAHALTIPLITKSDGSKFGKSASGAVWLDAEMTSPYAFFQFWIGVDDLDIPKLFKVFSFKSQSEIESILSQWQENPGARLAHRELAFEITALVHGEEEAQQAQAAAKSLFGQGELNDLSARTLDQALRQLPHVEVESLGESWVDLLAATGVVESKSAARRAVRDGGAYLNNQKISDENFAPSDADLLHEKFLVLRKGKRDLAAVILKK